MKTKKPDAKRAIQHFDKLCLLVSQRKSQFEGMTEEEVIKKLRKTREELWEEKLAALSCREPGMHYRKDVVLKKTVTNEAKKLLDDLRESIAAKPSPFEGMSKEEVIQHMRKTRKTLWEKKLALRS